MIVEPPTLSTVSWKISDIPGTISHQTANEPRHIMNAYFRPTIYPKPRIAAPVSILNTSFAFSAMVSPNPITRDVNVLFHQPNDATMKS